MRFFKNANAMLMSLKTYATKNRGRIPKSIQII